MAERTVCPDCGHDRIQHSREKCTEPGCPCLKTYMDLSPRRR